MNDPAFKNYKLQRTAIPVPFYQTPSILRKAAAAMSSNSFASPPPKVPNVLVTFPKAGILLVTLNRPKQLNCINSEMHSGLDALFKWFDNEPSLRCGIVTGTGRAFCAGADLKEWNGFNTSNLKRDPMPASGFGAMSRRSGKKPLIAAVNGIAFGGGSEIIINLDMVIASEKATFSLPEVKRGVIALAGALPRLARTVGRQRAMEMALTGRTYSAQEMKEWGLVNKVVGSSGEGVDSDVVKEAIKLAEEIAENSPDSIICTREGIKIAWEALGADEGTVKIMTDWYPHMDKGENQIEGVRAFVEKRKPKWVPSKL